MSTSPFTLAGAAAEPSNFAPLHTNRIFTGLWTNRSPLRDAAVTAYVERVGGGRQDSLLDGRNVEISQRLTLVRRPGSTVYNSMTFPPVQRFYGFRSFSTNLETVRIMADTQNAVYDCTGPNTKTAIYMKPNNPGVANRISFLGVGSTLYMSGSGYSDQVQWVQSAKTWQPGGVYSQGDYIVDTNNNLQVIPTSTSCNIVGVSISGGTVLLTINPPQRFATGMQLYISGISGAGYVLDDKTLQVVFQPNLNIVQFSYPGAPDVPGYALPSPGTLAVPLSTGPAGFTQPVWNPNFGEATVENTHTQWVNRGSATQVWGIDKPPEAPLIYPVALPKIYTDWIPNAVFGGPIVVDPANNIQQIVRSGNTGSAEPSWGPAYGDITDDGTAQWRNFGTGNWIPNFTYAPGALISVTFTYQTSYGDGNYYPVTVSCFFSCVQGGLTGSQQPQWIDGSGSQVSDNGVVWVNTGYVTHWADFIGPGTAVLSDTQILDPMGYIQTLTGRGRTGATEPAWAETVGASTQDNLASWMNTQAYAVAASSAQIYSFAYGSSITGEIGNLSDLSAPIVVAARTAIQVQGRAPQVNYQWDLIHIFRTVKGGSTQLHLATIQSPGAGQIFSYIDQLPDSALNVTWQGATALQLSRPPVGLTALAYHANRIFGGVGNTLYWSAGPDAVVFAANGNSAFPPLNFIVLQSRIRKLWATSIGLIVFCAADSYIIAGTGVAGDPFYPAPFLEGVGILSEDAFAAHGSTAYILTPARLLLSLDPGAGVVEIGFPIANRLKTFGTGACLTYHSGAAQGQNNPDTSGDTALYAGDGATGWYRMSAATAPESGFAWSPFAAFAGGTSAILSAEVTPGERRLLIGPGTAFGPILQRDDSVNSDNGAPFSAWGIAGSIVLAQPGQIAGIAFLTMEASRRGRQVAPSVLLGEVAGGFEALRRTRQDPPLLPPSKTLWSDRFHLLQNGDPVWCRHFQLRFDWGTFDSPDELLTYTIFGAVYQEMKTQ